MEKIIIDCHNHTRGSKYNKNVRGSDGLNYVEDFAKIAIDKNITMCAVSDHDVVNRELKRLLKDTDILTPEAVEISAKNYDRNKSLHILYYANTISSRVDELLSDVLNRKKQMLNLQIDKLSEMGFRIDLENVMRYVKQQGSGEDGINKWIMTKYLFKGINKDFNIAVFDKIFGKVDTEDKELYDWFYVECMKAGGEYYNQFKVKTLDYEPDVNVIGELAKKDNAILSIAHPNFTFKKGIEDFKKELPYYIEAGVNAIEVNTMADKSWVKEIIELKKKYDLILTFGSDCHKIGGIDDKHFDFGYSNINVTQEILKENLEKFREKIGI